MLPLFARELGADARLIGLIVGASTLTGVVLKFPAGAWSDVLGRRPLLVAGALVFALTPFSYLAVSGIGLLIAVRVFHGSATAIFGPVASASLSDMAPANRRATWLSTYSTCQGVGQAIGPVVAGYLIALGRFDATFALAGAVALLVPAIVWAWPARNRPDAAPEPPRRQQFVHGLAEVVRNRRILLTSAAEASRFLLNGALNAFLPLYASDVVGLSAADIGWLFGLQTVTTLAARPLLGMASDRIGRRGLIALGMVVCSAAVLTISIVQTSGGLFASVLVYAAGVAVTSAATSAYITDVASRARYGAAHGVFGTIYDVGAAAGPIMAGLLVAAWGYARMLQVIAAAAMTVACLFYLLIRELPAAEDS